MAIVILQAPPAVAAAFNEIPLVLQTPKARYDQLTQDLANATTAAERTKIQNEMTSLSEVRNQTTIDPVTFVAVIGNNSSLNRTVTLTPDPGPDGTARIDLSYIMRRAFVDITIYNATRRQLDYNLMAQGYIDDNGTKKAAFYAVNAVGQPGYYTSAEGFIPYAKLTNTPLIRYASYPLFVSLRNAQDGGPLPVVSFIRNGNANLGVNMPNPLGNIELANLPRPTSIRIIRNGETIDEYDIADGCVPDAPFYVRWINTSGGWDFWMFQRREETDEVEDVSTIQLVAENPKDTQATISLTASRRVTVGEGLLSKDDYRALVALPRSPRIQWYNEELQTWQTIVIAEGFSAAWNTRNGFGNVEFTFALPRLLTQF